MKRADPGHSVDAERTTRQRILDAAFATFLSKGYAGTSTLEIATRAKVSKRELYALFNDKSELFAAGIKHRTDIMRMPLVAPDLSDAEALKKTLIACGTSLLTGVTHPHVLSVHRLVIAESQRSPELAVILDREGRSANVAALTQMIREAQNRHLLREGNPAALAHVFSGLLWGDLFARLLLRVEKTPNEKEIARRARDATATFLILYG